MFPIFNEPLILSVTLNTYCGLNCTFCPFSPVQKELDNLIFEKLVEYVEGSKNLTTLAFSGGEPFLDVRLEKLLSVCKNNRIRTSIDTNCNWNKMPTTVFKCNQIRVKLLSLVEEKHDRLVGRKGHHQKVIGFINWLTHNFSGSKVLLFPVLSQNLNEMERVAEYAMDKGFYCNFFSYPREFSINAALSRQEYYRAIENIRSLIERYPKDVFIDFPLAGAKNRSLRNICPAVFISSHIDVDGCLRLCKYSSKKIGSLEELSLIDLWNKQRNEVKKLNNFCSNCELYPWCGGGCLANKTKFGTDYYCMRCANGRNNQG
ncbi:hypothetical protein DRP04_10420 [Archaeoglobales archaeon]|nr:MAG: hypothetical protein DRP04_10420 [Archaeoglobales archaeon]